MTALMCIHIKILGYFKTLIQIDLLLRKKHTKGIKTVKILKLNYTMKI